MNSREMNDIRTVWAHCFLNGKRIACYDFGIPIPMDASKTRPPSRQELILQAQGNLTTMRVAYPPYTGITYEFEGLE
jgi:hypothetical protein